MKKNKNFTELIVFCVVFSLLMLALCIVQLAMFIKMCDAIELLNAAEQSVSSTAILMTIEYAFESFVCLFLAFFVIWITIDRINLQKHLSLERCPNCQTPYEDGTLFCSKCGKQLTAKEVEQIEEKITTPDKKQKEE